VPERKAATFLFRNEVPLLNSVHDVSGLRQVAGRWADVRRSVEKLLKFDACAANSQIPRHLRLPWHVLPFNLGSTKQGNQDILFLRSRF
jgi:hypothetical protein